MKKYKALYTGSDVDEKIREFINAHFWNPQKWKYDDKQYIDAGFALIKCLLSGKHYPCRGFRKSSITGFGVVSDSNYHWFFACSIMQMKTVGYIEFSDDFKEWFYNLTSEYPSMSRFMRPQSEDEFYFNSLRYSINTLTSSTHSPRLSLNNWKSLIDVDELKDITERLSVIHKYLTGLKEEGSDNE